ncbi:hypothetical protein PQX77_002795, partial [Marasmius sp. AFHP31]
MSGKRPLAAMRATPQYEEFTTWCRLQSKKGTKKGRVDLTSTAENEKGKDKKGKGKRKQEIMTSVYEGSVVFIANDTYQDATRKKDPNAVSLLWMGEVIEMREHEQDCVFQVKWFLNQEEATPRVTKAIGPTRARDFFSQTGKYEVFKSDDVGYVWKESVLDLARILTFDSTAGIWIPRRQWYMRYSLHPTSDSKGGLEPVPLLDGEDDRFNPDSDAHLCCLWCNEWYALEEMQVSSEARPVGVTPVEMFLCGPVIRGGGWREVFGDLIKDQADWWLFSGMLRFRKLVEKMTGGSGEWPELDLTADPELFGEFCDQPALPHRLSENVETCRSLISSYRKIHICPL